MVDSTVSVIIPVFNSERTIRRAVDSALNQTVKPSEVIVINDGSTDKTLQILAEYQEDIIIIDQDNLGASAARNRGASLSKSTFLAFLDADDCWHPQKLEFQLLAFKIHTNAVLCWHDAKVIYEEDSGQTEFEFKELNYEYPFQKSFREIFINPYLGTPNVMIRSSAFFKVNGFDQSLEKGEDVDLWLRIATIGACIFIPIELSFIFQQKRSLSNSNGRHTYFYNVRVIDRLVKSRLLPPEIGQYHVDFVYSQLYQQWGSQLIVEGSYLAAIKKLCKSIKYSLTIRSVYLYIKAVIYYLSYLIESRL